MIALAPGMLERTFEHLRRCGAARRECLVFWSGPQQQPGYVDQVLHPRHSASAGHCELDPSWIGECWRKLSASARTIRAQVHTHPLEAYHSPDDDDYPLVHTPGYLSLVIPRFATRPVGLQDSYLAVRSEHGRWVQLDPHDAIEQSA